jgi:hypothetical protein
VRWRNTTSCARTFDNRGISSDRLPLNAANPTTINAPAVVPQLVLPQAQMNHTLMIEIQIKVGQIWGDCDSRRPNRYLEVKSISKASVQLKNLLTGHGSSVNRNRMKPGRKGYFLAMDPEILAEVQKQLAEAKQRQPASLNTPQTPNLTQAKAVSKVQPGKTTRS